MWSYYGAKTNVIHIYPKPRYDKIIEPFAGTARYALRYFEKDVLLVDKYDVIVKIWKWLQQCSTEDVLTLHRLKFQPKDNINTATYLCEEERLLVGFLVGFGFTSPRDTATPRLRNRPGAMKYTINKIANSLFKIRHWKIELGSYEEIPNQDATWFIDPPYQFGGHSYVKNNKHIDFTHLGEWSRERHGQVIVCESTRATWMDFNPITHQSVHNVHKNNNKPYVEAMWTNDKASYLGTQLQML